MYLTSVFIPPQKKVEREVIGVTLSVVGWPFVWPHTMLQDFRGIFYHRSFLLHVIFLMLSVMLFVLTPLFSYLFHKSMKP